MKSNTNPYNVILNMLKVLKAINFDDYLGAYDFGEWSYGELSLNHQSKFLVPRTKVKTKI